MRRESDATRPRRVDEARPNGGGQRVAAERDAGQRGHEARLEQRRHEPRPAGPARDRATDTVDEDGDLRGRVASAHREAEVERPAARRPVDAVQQAAPAALRERCAEGSRNVDPEPDGARPEHEASTAVHEDERPVVPGHEPARKPRAGRRDAQAADGHSVDGHSGGDPVLVAAVVGVEPGRSPGGQEECE